MSPPWSKPLDIDRLADGEADVDFAVPLAELPRLRSKIASVEGWFVGVCILAASQGSLSLI